MLRQNTPSIMPTTTHVKLQITRITNPTSIRTSCPADALTTASVESYFYPRFLHISALTVSRFFGCFCYWHCEQHSRIVRFTEAKHTFSQCTACRPPPHTTRTPVPRTLNLPSARGRASDRVCWLHGFLAKSACFLWNRQH